jgi:hypothetical protein
MSHEQRLGAARKAIEKQKTKDGMFAGQFEYETPEQRVSRIDAEIAAFDTKLESFKRQKWLEAGALIKSIPQRHRMKIIGIFKRLPRDGSYLLDVIHHYSCIEMDYDNTPNFTPFNGIVKEDKEC